MPPGPQRKRRGDVRIAILSLLSEQPRNGYGLIKEITDRSGGTWYPSPGSIYPTLQQLVDEELIEPVGEGKRTDFQLTATGREWIDSHADESSKVWQSSDERIQADAGLHESIGKLMGVIHQLRFAATDAQRTKAIETLDETGARSTRFSRTENPCGRRKLFRRPHLILVTKRLNSVLAGVTSAESPATRPGT